MMALLQRAQALAEQQHTAAEVSGASDGCTTWPPDRHDQQQQQQEHGQLLMPQQFVGVTGVYDIAKHYAYEKGRGVHSLSTMLPAMGGFDQFAGNSPSVILANALHQHQHKQQQQHSKQQHGQQNGSMHTEQQQQQHWQEPAACSFYESFSLSGESISHRIGEWGPSVGAGTSCC